MLRFLPLLLTLLICSCVTSRSIKHFSKRKNLTIKKVEAVNLFDGKIAIHESSRKQPKEPFYLLFDRDTLKYLSNSKWVTNNQFIYGIINKTDTSLTFSRSSMFPRYYTADTLLFQKNYAARKISLYDHGELIRVEFNQYMFWNDSLITTLDVYDSNLSKAPTIQGTKFSFTKKPEQTGSLTFNYSLDRWTLSKSLF